jgi:hypothetical protein
MADKGYTQTISTADFTETPNVVLEQPTGDVHVEGWDRPEIEISISDEGIFEIEQSGSQVIIKNRPGKFKLVDFLEEAGAELGDFGVDLSKVTARVERGLERNIQRRMQRAGRNFNFNLDLSNWKGGRDYHIMVPYNCDLSLRTSTGDMTVVGVDGTLLLQSSSGDIRGRLLAGNTLINTASGDIELEDLEGKLAVRSASGDIKTRTVGIQEITAHTASGDIELDLTRLPDGEFEVKTVSGNLALYLPSDAAFRAEVHTLSGSVGCGYPRNVVEYTARHRRETVLMINGGGKNLQVNTVSGDITIRPRRHDAQPTSRPTNPSATSTSGFAASSGSPTIRTGGAPTMDISRTQDANAESARVDQSQLDADRAQANAARQQAELEILQQVERGELTPEEALSRLSSLDGE